LGDKGIVVEDAVYTSRYEGDEVFLEASVGVRSCIEGGLFGRGGNASSESSVLASAGDEVSDDVSGGLDSGGFGAIRFIVVMASGVKSMPSDTREGTERVGRSADEVADKMSAVTDNDGRTRGVSMVGRGERSADEIADEVSGVTDTDGVTRANSMVERGSILRLVSVTGTDFSVTGGAGMSGGFLSSG